MALTAEETKELYQFFNVAFNAAPGVEYMNQLYEARQVMSMEQVVEVFTTKTQFTSIYPNFLTNETFASRLVDNVVGDSATAAAKASAAADIVAALALGWSRGKVIYTIFGNLANKETTDATWGNTATQFNNQVAVAKYYTETLLVNTTDTAKLQAVIANVTATTDVSTPAAIESVVYQSGGTTDTAGELSTTAGETVTGTPGNDTFAATLGLDLQDGDKILGKSGTDTLSIRAATGFAGVVTLESVENVDVNLRSTSTLNLLLSSGTNTVTVTSESVAGQQLSLTNVDLSTDFVVNASGTTLIVGAEDAAGTGDVIDFEVNVAAATLGITAGAIETVNLEVNMAGSGSVSLDSDSANKVVLTGAAPSGLNLTLTSTSALSAGDFNGAIALNAAAAAAEFTFSGGAGNDTVTIALSASDRLFGGAGTDSLVVSNTSSISVTNSNVVGFETLTINPSGQSVGTVAIANSGVSTINVTSLSGSTDLAFVLEQGGTINLANATGADDYSFGATGGKTLTINLTSGATIDDFTVSGASTVTINDTHAVGTRTISDLEFEHGVATVDFVRTGSGATTVSNILVSGVTDLGISTGTQSGAAGNLTVSNISQKSYTNTLATDLEALTVEANGSGSRVDVNGVIYGGSGLETVTLKASGDVTLVLASALSMAEGGNLTLTINQTGSGAVGSAGTNGIGVNMTASGSLTLDVNQNGADGDIFMSSMVVGESASGSIVATIDVAASGDFIMASANTRVADFTITVGAEGSATVAEIDGSATVALEINGAGSGTVIIQSISAGDLTSLGVDVGVLAGIDIDEITLTSGAGDITVAVASGALVTFGGISATKAIGDITITGSGDVLFAGVGATSVGHINVGADARVSASTAEFSAGAIGDLTLNGDGTNFSFTATNTVGAVVIGGSGVTLDFNSAVGTFSVVVESISITGSGTTTVNVGSAEAVGQVEVAIAAASTAELDFRNVDAAMEYSIGAGNHHLYISQDFASNIALTAGVGSSQIIITDTTVTAGPAIIVTDFTFGTDRLTIEETGLALGLASADVLGGQSSVALDVLVITAKSASLSVGSSVATTAATDVIVLATSTFADVSAALAYLGTSTLWSSVVGGSAATTLGSALEGVTANAGFLLLYADTDGDSYLYHVQGTAGTGLFSSTTNQDIDLIATFEGLDITTVSGATFANSFYAG